jgi:hypothetical protein
LRYHYSPEIDKSPSVDRRGEGKKKTDKTAQKKKKTISAKSEANKARSGRSWLGWALYGGKKTAGRSACRRGKTQRIFFFFDERLNGLAMCVRVFLAQADFWTLFGFTRGL